MLGLHTFQTTAKTPADIEVVKGTNFSKKEVCP
nr:hypothetical protein GGBNIMDK_00088 [Bacillus cereus]